MESLELCEVSRSMSLYQRLTKTFGFTLKSYSAFWGDENVLGLERNVAYTSYTFVKTNWAIYLRSEHFIVCKSYINKMKLKI